MHLSNFIDDFRECYLPKSTLPTQFTQSTTDSLDNLLNPLLVIIKVQLVYSVSWA